MADEQESLSGWESLPATNNNDDDSTPVVIELPAEGFPYHPVDRNASSSNRLNGNEQDGSTTSSYSIVNRIDNLNVQGSAKASCSSASSSLPRSADVNNGGSISSSLPYSSQISRTCSISSSTDDSLISQFDYISVSGEAQKRCRKCKFHNSENSVTCKICGRALVANPNISMDEQIAIHLHQKELQNAQTLALEEERKRNRKSQDPLYDFALVMAKDIRGIVTEDTDYGSKGFNVLPESNLVRLGINFFERVKAFENSKISLAYKITARSDLEHVKEEGFSAPRNNYRTGGTEATREVDVSTKVGAALLSFRKSYSGLLTTNSGGNAPTHLASIPENRDTGTINHSDKLCWIVATAESVPDNDDGPQQKKSRTNLWFNQKQTQKRKADEELVETILRTQHMDEDGKEQDLDDSPTGANNAAKSIKMLPFPSQILPLVYFDNEKIDDDVRIQPLLKNLSIVFKGLFRGSTSVLLGVLPDARRKPTCVKILGSSVPGRLLKAAPNIGMTVGIRIKHTNDSGNIAKEGVKNDSPDSHVGIQQKNDSEGHGREHSLFRMTTGVLVLAVSSRGTMAKASSDRKIYLWSQDLGDYNTVKGNGDAVNALAFSHPPSVTDEKMASGDMQGVVNVWDTSNRGNERLLLTCDGEGKKPILDIRFFPSGKTLAVVDWLRDCWLWKLSDGTCTCRLKGRRPEARQHSVFGLQSAAFSPDGQSMASSATNSTYIYYWRFNGAKELLSGHKTIKDFMGLNSCHIRALSFSPDGSRLASAATDGTVRLWNIKRNSTEQRGTIEAPRSTKKPCEQTFENIPKGVSCLAFSPNGKLLAGGGNDGIVRVWDIEAGCQVDSFSGHIGTAKSVAFFPDGKTLVSSGLDRTVRFWIVGS